MTNPLHVVINDRRQIENDTLGELQDVIRRNTPPNVTLPIAELTAQTLQVAWTNVKGSDPYTVFTAVFADGTQVHFTQRSAPRGFTNEGILRGLRDQGLIDDPVDRSALHRYSIGGKAA